MTISRVGSKKPKVTDACAMEKPLLLQGFHGVQDANSP
jgi:hypothetical protein